MHTIRLLINLLFDFEVAMIIVRYEGSHQAVLNEVYYTLLLV